jgi:prepilin-type N-terminal cleavage/methylation domain-containing protein
MEMVRSTRNSVPREVGRRGALPARRARRGFSILELLISLSIIAILIGLLLPMLIYARSVARTTMCAGNLRQMSTAWSLYLSEYGAFPQYTEAPDWKYGGAVFVAKSGAPVLASDRPINAFMTDGGAEAGEKISLLFRCPSDRGIVLRAQDKGGLEPSVPKVESCFENFGTSYRANPYLMNSTRAGVDGLNRPLWLHEIEQVPTSRLLLVGDAEWYFAVMPPDNDESRYDASWHEKPRAGNMLAVDGSVRFVEFHEGEGSDYLIYPTPHR